MNARKSQPHELATDGCNICGSTTGHLVTDRLRFNVRRNVVKCSRCGLVYQFPLMSGNEQKEFYSDAYRNLQPVKGHYLPREASAFFHIELAPNAARLKRVEKYLAPSSRCLEIGSAAGSFLYLLRKKCSHCVGVEPHKLFSAFARNELRLTVFDRPVEELKFQPRSFDAIFMFHVLHQFRNPHSVLKAMSRTIKSGGYLFLELPNIEDALLTLCKRYSSFYYQPAINYYFSRKSMARILEETGFHYHIRMLQRYSFLNHLNWIIRGKPQAKPSFKTFFPLSVFDKLYRTLLCGLGRADTLFVIAQRAPTGDRISPLTDGRN